MARRKIFSFISSSGVYYRLGDDGEYVPERGNNHDHSVQLREDIKPFVSVIDDSIVGSRKQLIEHNKRNEVCDVGPDPFFKDPDRIRAKIKEDLPKMEPCEVSMKRAMEQLGADRWDWSKNT